MNRQVRRNYQDFPCMSRLKFGHHLDGRRVHEHADSRGEGVGAQVVGELSTDNSGVSVSSNHFAVDDADVGSVLLGRSSVVISDSLAHVKLGVLAALNAINADQDLVRVLVETRSATTNISKAVTDHCSYKFVVRFLAAASLAGTFPQKYQHVRNKDTIILTSCIRGLYL